MLALTAGQFIEYGSGFTTATVSCIGSGYTDYPAYDWCTSKLRQRRQTRVQKKAQALLYSYLTPDQRASYDANYTFLVTGNHTGKHYEVGVSWVYELDRDGERVAHLCFTPADSLCRHDVVLAKKIALESDEKATLKIANRNQISCGRSTVCGASLLLNSQGNAGDRWRNLFDSATWTGR